MTKTKETSGGPTLPESLSMDEFKGKFPLLYDAALSAGRDEGLAAGITAERERVAEILAETHTGQLPTALKSIESGATVKDAFKALLSDDRSNAAQRLAALTASNEESLDTNTQPSSNETPGTPEAKWEKMTAPERQEFNDSLEMFTAFEKANAAGAVKIRSDK